MRHFALFGAWRHPRSVDYFISRLRLLSRLDTKIDSTRFCQLHGQSTTREHRRHLSIPQELREREKNSQRLVENLQEKACKLHEQLQQRESALILCRNEVKSHLAAMDEVKTSFQCELQQREMVVRELS